MDHEIKLKSFSSEVNFDPFYMPAYHEKAETQSIPPRNPIESKLKAIRTSSSVVSLSEVKASKAEVKKVEISRQELDAKLARNKAEVDAIAAEMRREMTEWREQMRSDMRDVKDAIKSQQSSLDKHFSAQETKISASLQIQEHKFEKSLGDAKLEIIKWVLGVPTIIFTLYKFYGAITGNP